ncbi:MAG: hypothetical protein ACUZ8A_06505 [Candidatus Bathyanammoxibius sp.]
MPTRKFYKAALLSAVAAILVATPILAFLYQAPFTIVESAGIDYDMFPAIVGANNTFMAANGYMEADALDTRVETLAGSDKPHMVADHLTLGAVPVEGNSQTNLFFTTGEPDLVSMDLLLGYEGFVTISDDATLEPGDDFRFEFQDVYVNTDAGAGKTLLSKLSSFTLTVSAANAITASIPQAVGSWSEVAPTFGAEGEIHSMTVFAGELYGSTTSTGLLLKWNGTNAWVEAAAHLTENRIRSLAVFNGTIYGGTANLGKLYEWNGTNLWVEKAPQLLAQTNIYALAVHNGKLYGGTSPAGKLFEWNDVNLWVQRANTLGGSTEVRSLAVHNGKLYGASLTDGRLLEWNDVNAWVQAAPQLNAQIIHSLEVHNGKLYGGTGNARLFEWNDVNAWVQVAPQLGVPTQIVSLQTFGGRLYGGTNVTGELHLWNEVNAWVQAAAQLAEVTIRSLADFDNTLYGGTANNGKLYQFNPDAASVTATGVATGEHDIVVGTLDRGDIDTYAAGANIAVNTGAGLLPVRVLEEVELTAPAASVTFSNIDTAVAAWDTIAGVTSRHLVVVVNAASDQATTAQVVNYRFNGDAGNNYDYQELNGTGAVVGVGRTDNGNALLFTSISGTTTANAFDGGMILVPHAFNALNHKATISLGGASETIVQTVAGRWADTSAITSFTMFPAAGTFIVGSIFQLGVVDERYLIEEQILSGGDGTFTFAAITASEGELAVVGYLRSDQAAVEDEVLHQINTDAVGANYAAEEMTGIGAVAAAAGAVSREVGMSSGNNATANVFGVLLATYSQFADGVNQPHYLTLSGYHESSGPTAQVRVMSGRRANVAAITQLDYEPNAGANFKDGSMMSLYRAPQFVIQRTTLAAPAASVTFSNIPQGYEALQLNVYTRTDGGGFLAQIEIEFNGDNVVANYNRQQLVAIVAGVSSARSAGTQSWLVSNSAGAGANQFAGGHYTIPQYAATDRHKHVLTIHGATVEPRLSLMSNRWKSTDAINAIVLTPQAGNFIAGSVFELVGVMPSVEFQIAIDGVIEGAASTLNVDVLDNTNDWLVMDNSTTQFMPYMASYEQSGQALHFTGAALGEVNVGVIHDAATKWWISIWFKLDADFDSSATVNQFLLEKPLDGTHFFRLRLQQSNGSLELQKNEGGPLFSIFSTETSWNAGQWYHAIASISSANGARLRVDNGAAVTNANTAPMPNGGTVRIGRFATGGAQGVVAILSTIAIGTDDLTTAEETALYGGGVPSRSIIPTDANNIWYLDEGTGVVAVDSGLDGDNGAIGVTNTWVADGSLFRLWYQPIAIVENTGEASTADAGTAITLDDAILTQANDFWNGAKLVIVTTTDTFAPQGESSVITDFDAALDRLTFDTLTAIVDAGDTYTIDFGTLADRAATAQDGRITWGVNPTGISVTLGSMVASSQPIVGETEAAPARDILPPITVSDWFGDGTVGGSTLTNPIRPLITAMSDNTTLTEIQVWRLMGIIAVLFATIATAFTVRQHQGITAIIAGTILGGLVAFDSNIFPMWTLVIAIGLFIAGVVAERSPSL